MTAASRRARALSLSFALALVCSCSGSRTDSLNNNINAADGATDEDASTDEEMMVPPVALDAGPAPTGSDSGEDAAFDASVVADAGSDAAEIAADAVVAVELADAADPPDTTVVTEVPRCGNGVIDPGEQCDQGGNNSDTVASACRSNCQNARCGDGVVDEGEACDQGASNSNSVANACRLTCVSARCGDDVIDNGEQCDSGDARSDTAPGGCRLNCRSAYCGDGVRDPNEACDDGNTIDTDMCRNTCRTLACGNGVVDPGEECDDGNTTNADTCQATCRRPACGDGVVDAAEQCDDANTSNNDGCRSNCQRGCTGPEECSDSLFCNGPERCVDGLCQPPTAPPSLGDGVDCTVDACDEGSGRVTHTPMASRCEVDGPSCSAATSSTQTATCDPARGCVVRTMTQGCGDSPSACALMGNRSYTLTTYAPACDSANASCGSPTPSTRACPNLSASCTVGRVFTGLAAATCNPNTETCGNAVPVVDDCATRDQQSCAADASSFTRVRGTCDPANGCEPVTTTESCSSPADACAAGRLRTFEPTCAAENGCGTARQTSDTSCPAPGPSCNAAALTRYTPACASGTSCSPDGAAQPAEPCPAAAPSCAPNASGIAALVRYTPACASGTSCSPTGTPQAPLTCPTATASCAPNANGEGALTSYTPACASGTSCSPTGTAQTPVTCPAAAASCAPNANGEGALTRYRPACASGTSCSATGAAQTPVTCPAAAASCGTNPAGQVVTTRYSPACASGTSCSATGAPVVEPCPSRTTCASPGPRQPDSLTAWAPSCTGPSCSTTGVAQQPVACPAAAQRCTVEGQRAVILSYTPRCQDGTSCIPSGVEQRSFCDQAETACGPNSVAIDTVNSCEGAACATVTTRCATGTRQICINSTRLETQQGGCLFGTGCTYAFVSAETCPAPQCFNTGASAVSCGGCGVGDNGALGCNRACQVCSGGCAGGVCRTVLPPIGGIPGGVVTTGGGGIVVP